MTSIIFFNTLLFRAAKRDNRKLLKLSIDYGANINAQRGLDTPLIYAAMKQHKEIIKILLDKDADMNAQDIYGYTALMWAITRGDEKIVKLLLDHGADVTTKGNLGVTALRIAEENLQRIKVKSYKNIFKMIQAKIK